MTRIRRFGARAWDVVLLLVAMNTPIDQHESGLNAMLALVIGAAVFYWLLDRICRRAAS